MLFFLKKKPCIFYEQIWKKEWMVIHGHLLTPTICLDTKLEILDVILLYDLIEGKS